MVCWRHKKLVGYVEDYCLLRLALYSQRQHDRVVSVSVLKSRGRGFKPGSDHLAGIVSR